MLLLMITSAASPSTSPASETCESVLQSCDSALKAKQRELDLSDLGIKIRDDDRERLQKENEALRGADTSILKNPVLWLGLGVFLGAYAARR